MICRSQEVICRKTQDPPAFFGFIGSEVGEKAIIIIYHDDCLAMYSHRLMVVTPTEEDQAVDSGLGYSLPYGARAAC